MATPVRALKSKRKSMKASGPNQGFLAYGAGPEHFPPLVSLPVIVPDRVRVRFRYMANLTFTTSTINQPGVQVFAGNSIFDPDVTNVGGTCAGTAAWVTLYSTFCVLRSRCKVTLINTSVNPLTAVLIPTAGTKLTNSYLTEDAAEQPYAKQVFINSSQGGHDVQVMDTTITTARIAGLDPIMVMTERNYSALFTQNPAVLWYWNISMQSLNSTALSVVVNVQMDYDTMLYTKQVIV